MFFGRSRGGGSLRHSAGLQPNFRRGLSILHSAYPRAQPPENNMNVHIRSAIQTLIMPWFLNLMLFAAVYLVN
jgi:hypothetical protein